MRTRAVNCRKAWRPSPATFPPFGGCARSPSRSIAWAASTAAIHNAGIGYREPERVETEDGVPQVFATNVLAPFVLTALIEAEPPWLV